MQFVARGAVVAGLLLMAFVDEARAGSRTWRGAPVIMGSSGEQLCAKHHEALQRTTVFGPGGGVCVLVQPSKKFVWQLARSPNALRFDVHRKADVLYSRAVEVWYCVRCEEEVQRAIREKR
jgi:hypothetical protein